MLTRISRAAASAVLLSAALPTHAALLKTFVTGEFAGSHVVFEVTFDPAVAGSAAPVVRVTEPRAGYRLDGIDFVSGTTSAVVVGAQLPTPGGAITHYNVSGVGPPVLADFVPATNTAAGAGTTRPSTVLTTPGHYLYTENQFGFAGAPHRIMRTPVGATPGVPSLVFDGAAAAAVPAIGVPLVNMEGLEIVGSRLYFFAEDHTVPPGAARALYSIALDVAGVFDPTAPVPIAQELGGLAGTPDGADELDFDPFSDLIYGSNMITGEIIFFDPVGGLGGVLISAGEIGGSGDPALDRLGTARLDGIRSTGDGFLVLTGLAGVIASVDIGLAMMPGPALGAVRLLFDDPSYSFDDLTPLTPASLPEPSTLSLAAGLACLVGIAGARRRLRTRVSRGI